ncbi:hypothetical protein R3P38DRAFT_3228415 [Favolaschia claudopus]|uniref:Uncharacterized protein n=1 Tax=Favolaschia claudopus TaxID=2862362 RepID=A0AAV9ZR55_9AGAR
MTQGLWSSQTHKKALGTVENATYDEKHRFDSSRTKLQGELRAVLVVLPEENFGQWSNTSSRIRNDIGAVFVAHFTPVDGADRLNVDTFLNHKLVMHIAVAIIYGKKKANKMARNQPCSSGPRCMREIHNISNFTPGFIACAGTIGLRSRSKPVLALFREWDEEIFPESETSLGAVKEMDVGASAGDLNAALDAIRNAEVEQDVEMGGAGNAGNGEEEGDEDGDQY